MDKNAIVNELEGIRSSRCGQKAVVKKVEFQLNLALQLCSNFSCLAVFAKTVLKVKTPFIYQSGWQPNEIVIRHSSSYEAGQFSLNEIPPNCFIKRSGNKTYMYFDGDPKVPLELMKIWEKDVKISCTGISELWNL